MKVTIVIPFHNNDCEDINTSIDMLMKQTIGFKEMEILLLNLEKDNSKLNSLDTNNVKIVESFNIYEIKGEYLSFFQIGNNIGIDMFKHLYKTITEERADFVSAKIEGSTFVEAGGILNSDFNAITSMKLIKKEVLLNNNLSHIVSGDKGSIDLLNIMLYLSSEKYYFSHRATYNHVFKFDEMYILNSIDTIHRLVSMLLYVKHSRSEALIFMLIKHAMYLIDKNVFLNNLEYQDQCKLFNDLDTMLKHVDHQKFDEFGLSGYVGFFNMVSQGLSEEAIEYMKLFRSKRHWYQQTKRYENFFRRNPNEPEDSLSWKVTKPLRKAQILFDKAKNKIIKFSLILLSLFVRMGNLNKPIWLVCEREDQAEDNGYFFFKYCRETYPKQGVYYVINKNSPHLSKVEKMGNVIHHSSLKHKIYMLLANIYISAWTFEEVGFPKPKKDFVKLFNSQISKKLNVCLQHGVIIHNISPYLHKERYNQDLIISSSKYEKEIIKSTLGYDDEEVVVTGLARFDNLKNIKVKKQILIMPTWRRHLFQLNKHQFLRSDYFMAYKNLVNNKDFLKLIEERNIAVKFYVHSQMQKFMKYFVVDHPNIEFLVKSNATVSELLKESALLVTDYSSVSSDFLYMEKPVIMYQFDPHNNHHAPVDEIKYSDLGIIASEEGELISQVGRIVKNGFKLDKKYIKNSKRIFELKDKKNSERIYGEICNLTKRKVSS